MHTRHNQAQEVHQAVVEGAGSLVQYNLLLQVPRLERLLRTAVAWTLAVVEIGSTADSSFAEHTEHADPAVEYTEGCRCPRMDHVVLARLQRC